MVSDSSVRPSGGNVLGYLPEVDGLRGIAILLVLWYHAPFIFQRIPEFSVQGSPWAMLGPFGRVSLGSWIGVDLFFVVSGFLITLLLIGGKERGGSLLVFWQRRALRILPLAIFYLVSLLLLVRLGDPLNILASFDAWPWYVFYLGNIHIALHGWQPLAVMILWSLAIEEQFYLLWPFLVQMYNAHQLLRCSIACMLIAPLVRALTLTVADYPATYVFTFCRFDALAAGSVVAVLYNSRNWCDHVMASCKRLAAPALVVIILTLLVPFSPSVPQTRTWFFSVFGYSWLAISFAILLMASLGTTGLIKFLLTSPILRFLGRRCYGLYLWHVVAGGIAMTVLGQWQVGFYGHTILWLIILVGVSSASWLLFEEPILRLKRLFSYAEVQSPTSQAPHGGLIGLSR